MSFLLCLGLLALAPSLAYAANLEIPGNGDKLSGIGVISGWKCRAGTVTVRLDGGEPLPTQYGLPRADTIPVCRDDGYNGFVTYWNWAILGDGWHTAVAYDNGVEFDRSTFTVATTGEEFLTQDSGRAARAQIPDFPSPGEITWFEWNTSTQHLETVASDDIRGWCLSPGLAEPGVPDTVARQPVLRPPPLPCPRA